jgi:hypothetical protein
MKCLKHERETEVLWVSDTVTRSLKHFPLPGISFINERAFAMPQPATLGKPSEAVFQAPYAEAIQREPMRL